MNIRFLAFSILLALFVVSSFSVNGSAALLTLTSTNHNITKNTESYTAEKIKPPECDSLTLDNTIITGSGTFSDTNNSSSLLIGSSGSDTINGLDDGDCLFGGSGTNTLDGGGGSDVCIGGSGNDTFTNCETCYKGGGGSDDTTGCTTTHD